MKSTQSLRLLLLMSAAHLACAANASEQDYYSELPEVLTVTRLAQPLSETPGAVTIIDRATIRRSGARELVDVLRLVPGYIVGGRNGANPGAAYHAPLDEYGTRNLVLIDGRSVYSSFLLGNTQRGMMGILLEDIERIEVLRGSNSAAYGANAMFGVINIVTRHTADTQGAELSVTAGKGSIHDHYARLGWGNDAASFRLTAGRRQDSGYLQAYDDKNLSQMHFRSDLRPAHDQEAFLAAGIVQLAANEGVPGYFDNGSAERTEDWHDYYVHGAWERRRSATEKIRISGSYEEETVRNDSPFRVSDNKNNPTRVLDTITISFGGRAKRLNLEFQHQLELSEQWRAVWGAGYKYEAAESQALYYNQDSVSADEKRLFGSLEWRPHARWLINAGAFVGAHEHKGAYTMPRLMANFHLAADHTLRAGSTTSARMPTLYELAADRRYYPATTAPLPLRYDASTGKVNEEILQTEELGYFGNFRAARVTLDVRAYRERMEGVIDKRQYRPTGYTLRKVDDYVNYRDLETYGIEYQLRWKPALDTEIWLNQNFQRLHWTRDYFSPGKERYTNLPPERALTFALFQQLPHGAEFGIVYSQISEMTQYDLRRMLKPIRRADIRLAYPFRLGATRAEAAIAIQAVGGNYVASYPDVSHPPMIQERRAFGTLRLEF